jgi:hypothetical protein
MSSFLVFNRVYRLEIQSVIVGIFDLSCKLVHLYLLSRSSPPPPPPCVNKYRSIHSIILYIVQRGGGGGDGVMWRAYTGLNTVCDQIPNLQNCFTTPNKNLGGEGASDTCRKVPLRVNF